MKREGQHGKFHITKVIGEALWCIFPKIKKKSKSGFHMYVWWMSFF